MREGISALKKNETWDLVPLPAGVKPISCKWVYKVKRRSDGSVERARLIARGFSQQYGIDYDETFSPVAKMTTVRVLISLATSQSWRLWRMDVKNAFLYGVSLHPSPAFSLPCIHTTRMKFHIQSNQPFIPHSKPSPKSPASRNASFPDLRLALKKKWRDSSRSYLGWLTLFDLPFSLSCSIQIRFWGRSTLSHPPGKRVPRVRRLPLSDRGPSFHVTQRKAVAVHVHSLKLGMQRKRGTESIYPE